MDNKRAYQNLAIFSVLLIIISSSSLIKMSNEPSLSPGEPVQNSQLALMLIAILVIATMLLIASMFKIVQKKIEVNSIKYRNV